MSKQIDIRMVGETIKQLRLSHNWTQERLADRAGYSVRNLRRIETDGTGNIEVVNNFADIFQVSAVDILTGCLLFLSVRFSKRKKMLSAFAIRCLP
ncbi:MAG: helix-turn-helix transcriptional regulator [Bacilli bacterium]|nr:helix-turn-helix transcriptional regulator [Bacilli bacterium]